MRQTLALLKFVVASLFLLLGASVFAENLDAQSWMKKIQAAAKKLNYSGTFVYQQGSQMRTSRVTHLLDGKNEIEKLEVMDGKAREYIRTNDEVICYVPEAKTLLIEKRVTQDVFPAIFAANPAELREFYHMKLDADGRVAGRDCQTIVLEPKDGLRYGYRLWADKATGLLLRSQTLDENQRVIEQIAFTQVVIGGLDRASAKPTYADTKGWRVENEVMSQSKLSGWAVKALPPGFRKVREVKRLVSDTSLHGQAVQREVSHMVFSDGLAAISVFIEPGSQSRTEGSVQQGALNIVGKRHGDFWLTIVGEVPPAAIRQVANSIEFKSK